MGVQSLYKTFTLPQRFNPAGQIQMM